MNVFAFTNIKFYYLVTSGETDQMEKKHRSYFSVELHQMKLM